MAEASPPTYTRKRSLVPAAVMLAALSLTALAAAALDRTARVRQQARFEAAVATAQLRLSERLSTYVALLRATRGLFAASAVVDAPEFRRFVGQLELNNGYPGIQGIGYTQRVSPGEEEALLGRMRAGSFPDFRLWPPPDGRAERHAILFLEPLDRRNAAAIGFDMSSESTRREAMERARDTAAAALSGKVTLVQEIEAEVQAGFLIYLPLYEGNDTPPTVEERRRKLRGFVYSPFRAGDFFDAVFPPRGDRDLGLRVFDAEEITPERLLYDSRYSEAVAQSSLAPVVRTLTIAGRTWTVQYAPLSGLLSRTGTYLVPGVSLLGLLLSLALFFVTRTLQRARAEAENHRERLYDILMKAPASISIRSGDDLRFTLVNPLYQALAGPDRALLGRSTGEALGDLQSPLTGVAERVYRTGEKFEAHEMPAQLGDREVYLDAVFVPLRDERGRVDSVMSFAIDVTGQVQARRRIEEALRLRDEFLSIASHELRTPLTPLMLRLESMRRELERPPEVILGRLPNHIEVMRRQVRRLADLVDGLLDVSRIREGRLSLQPEAGVDLLEVAREVVARFQPEAARVQSPLVLEAEGPVSGTWDRLRLEQVVTNLVSNALKYGPGKPVRVRVGAVESGAVLEVSDEGIGIAPEALPRIFDRFARGVSDRHYGGLGLGLYISRQIVDAMHGSIEVHSERGKRTVFRVVLPRDPEPARPQEEGGAPVGAPPGDSPTPA